MKRLLFIFLLLTTAVYAEDKDDEISVDREYEKLLLVGDNYFESKNYEKAKKMYERALSRKPAEVYPREKIN